MNRKRVKCLRSGWSLSDMQYYSGQFYDSYDMNEGKYFVIWIHRGLKMEQHVVLMSNFICLEEHRDELLNNLGI